jgi:uncharacterized membrane protein
MSEANAIAVDNGTIYTAGRYNDGSVDHPCYWTGTTMTDLSPTLPPGTVYAYASSIAVVDGTLYIVGAYRDPSSGLYVGSLWTGGNLTPLPVSGAGVTDIFPNAVAVVGGTVYVAGCYVDTRIYRACLWTGTIVANLPSSDSGSNSYANGIYANGSDIYVAGSSNNGTNDIACYWNGTGTRVDLPVTSMSSWANSVGFGADTVFTVGNYNNGGSVFGASYWTDTTKNDVSLPTSGVTTAELSSIHVR